MKHTPERYLKELTVKVTQALSSLDAVMKQPSTVERGRNIGRIATFLDMANDAAMHFGLGYGWKKIGNVKKGPVNPLANIPDPEKAIPELISCLQEALDAFMTTQFIAHYPDSHWSVRARAILSSLKEA